MYRIAVCKLMARLADLLALSEVTTLGRSEPLRPPQAPRPHSKLQLLLVVLLLRCSRPRLNTPLWIASIVIRQTLHASLIRNV